MQIAVILCVVARGVLEQNLTKARFQQSEWFMRSSQKITNKYIRYTTNLSLHLPGNSCTPKGISWNKENSSQFNSIQKRKAGQKIYVSKPRKRLISHAGIQVTQWDSENKGKSSWTGKRCFVLGVSLCNLRRSMADCVPCNRRVWENWRANSSGDCLLMIIKVQKHYVEPKNICMQLSAIRLLCALGSWLFVSAYSYYLIIF